MPTEVGAAYVTVLPSARGFGRALRAQVEDELGDAGATAGRRFSDGFGNEVQRSNRVTVQLEQSLLRVTNVSATLGRRIILAQVLTGAAGAAGALGAALLPVVGVAASLPAPLLAAGQAAGVAKLALSGVGDAVKAIIEGDPAKIAEAMAALPPPAREFAREIAALNPQFQQLRATAAEGLVPGLLEGLRAATGLFPVFNQVIGQTAQAMGRVAAEGGRMLASGPWRADFAAIGASNARIVEMLGTALLALANIFRNLLAAAAPFAEDLVGGALLLIQWADRALAAARASGQLAAFFERAQQVGHDLISLFLILGQALVGVFRNAGGFGQGMLDGLINMAAALRDLVESARGQEAIANFFAALERIGPMLGALAVNVGRIFTALASQSGGLEGLLQVLIVLSGALATLLEQNPALAAFAAQFLLLSTVVNKALRALQIQQTIAGIKGLGNAARATSGGIGQFVAGFRRIDGAAAGTAGRLGAVTRTIGGFITGLVATIGRAALGLLAAIGPVGWIAIGVAALAALIIANWDTVRGWLITAWNFIRDAAVTAWQAIYNTVAPIVQAIVDFIQMAFQLQVAVLTTIWNAIRTAATTAWNAIWGVIGPVVTTIATFVVTQFNNIVAFLTTIWNAVLTAATTAWNAIVTVVTTVVGAIVNFVTAQFTAVQTFITTVWTAISTFFATIWQAIVGVFTAVLAAIFLLITGHYSQVGEIIRAVWNEILAFFGTIWAAITALFTTVLTALATLLGTTWTNIQTLITTVWTAIGTFFATIWDTIQTLFTTVLTAITEFLAETWDNIHTTIQTLWTQILEFLTDTWDTIFETITTAVDNILDAIADGFAEALDTVIEWGNDAIDAILDFVPDMLQAGIDLITGLIDGIKQMAGAAVDAAVGVVTDAIAAAKGALGIGSPSKVFASFGEDSGRGFVVGLERSEAAIVAAVRGLAGTAPDMGVRDADRGAGLPPVNVNVTQAGATVRDIEAGLGWGLRLAGVGA